MHATHRLALLTIAASLFAACGDNGSGLDGGDAHTSGDMTTHDAPGSDAPGSDMPGSDAPGMDMPPPVDGGVDMPAPVDLGPDLPAILDLGIDMPAVTCATPVIPSLAAQDLTAGATTFNSPIFMTQVPGDDDAFYVVERAGRIRIWHVSTATKTTFLDIRTTIGGPPTGGDEYGLLGLAFHPGYATNGRFFVAYTYLGAPGANVVAEYARSAADPYVADTAEVARLVQTADDESNHNGGWIAFGPDGFLYAAIGDGGGGCDAHGTGNGNGQDTSVLFGKMLRLDVDDAAGAYAAAGNPFSGATGLPQIWAYGLRNPWRDSFDRVTGDLYFGDVGQNAWEEVDFQPASSTGGENYGWRAYEGTRLASTTSGCADVTPLPTGVTMPITEYSHATDPTMAITGNVIVGGYVYRGSAIPGLVGDYLYGDAGSDRYAALTMCGGTMYGPVAVPALSGVVSGISSFAEDNHGELYMLGLFSGDVQKIVPGP